MNYMFMGSRVLGLNIRTDQQVPGLATEPLVGEADVDVTFAGLPAWVAQWEKWPVRFTGLACDEQGRPLLQLRQTVAEGHWLLSFADDTRFLIDAAGRRVWASWPAAFTPEDAAVYLLGPVLGFLLGLRGVTCLHASAVVVDGHAVALLGAPGAGKSTTAAAFAQRGHPVLTDDIVALWERDGHFEVQPGYAHLKLWPTSEIVLWGSARTLPTLTPTWDKRYLALTSGEYRLQREALPLAAAYLLDGRVADPIAPRVEPLAGPQALLTLVGNTYNSTLLTPTQRRAEFEVLRHLLECVPLRRVVPHADPARLSALCELITADVRSSAGTVDEAPVR